MMQQRIEEAPEYIPHLIMQPLLDENCEGELTPERKANSAGQQVWIYSCDCCEEVFTEEEILEVLNDYDYTGD